MFRKQNLPFNEVPGHEARECPDCHGRMQWIWGGEITYWECATGFLPQFDTTPGCGRIDPVPNIVIEKGKVTLETGNKKEIIAEYSNPEERTELLKKITGVK